jgi:predicted O-linked N-acetylglucosamine transferase (SPINDLY family)
MLRAGVPVITLVGETFASRVGASMLIQLGMDELVTFNHEEYKTLAIEIASNPGKLELLKDKLRESLTSSKLFDSKGYTRNLEALFQNTMNLRGCPEFCVNVG